MKKLIATALVLLTCGAVYALPVGNPSEGSLFANRSCSNVWSVRLGFSGDYVFNRHMMGDTSGGGSIHQTTIDTNSGYLALNICDRVDLFTRLGASQIEVKAEGTAIGLEERVGSEFQFSTEFSWSIGARATIWECRCLSFGLEGEYFQTNPDVTLYVDNVDAYIPINGFSSKYREWQAGLGASYSFKTRCPTFAMVPYLAVKFSGSKLDLGGLRIFSSGSRGTTIDIKNAKNIGYAVGTSITLCDRFSVTIEGRFADETALYINSQFSF